MFTFHFLGATGEPCAQHRQVLNGRGGYRSGYGDRAIQASSSPQTFITPSRHQCADGVKKGEPTVCRSTAVPRSKRLSLSFAVTASVALASLPLAFGPASAARVPEGTTLGIGVMEASSNASQFNLGSLRAQGASTDLVGQTKNLQPIAFIPTSIGESAGGRTAGGCPTGTGQVFAAGKGGCGGWEISAGKLKTKSLIFLLASQTTTTAPRFRQLQSSSRSNKINAETKQKQCPDAPNCCSAAAPNC